MHLLQLLLMAAHVAGLVDDVLPWTCGGLQADPAVRAAATTAAVAAFSQSYRPLCSRPKSWKICWDVYFDGLFIVFLFSFVFPPQHKSSNEQDLF